MRRNGCPKGCFWRVRFFSVPLRVFTTLQAFLRTSLKGAEKKRTLQTHPFGQPFLRTPPLAHSENRHLTPIHLESIAIHLPFLSRCFRKSMPSSWQKVVYTPPICITIRLPFVSRCFCRSIRVRGRWNTPKKNQPKVFLHKVFVFFFRIWDVRPISRDIPAIPCLKQQKKATCIKFFVLDTPTSGSLMSQEYPGPKLCL